MDHDKQITSLNRAREEFLNLPLHPDNSDMVEYDLDAEFAKSRKNRNIWIPISLIGFILLMGAAAVPVFLSMEASSKQIPQSIKEQFQDIKLREILDTTKKQTTELETAKRQLTEAVDERDGRLKALRQETQFQVDMINQSGGKEDDKNTQIAQIRYQAALREAQIRKEYEGKIQDRETLIQQAQQRLTDYESKLTEKDRQRQELLNSQQRAAELERQKLITYYQDRQNQLEAAHQRDLASQRQATSQIVAQMRRNHEEEIKRLILLYNPVFSEPEIQRILEKGPMPVTGSSEAQKINQTMAAEEAWSQENYQLLNQSMANIRLLFNRIRGIPYQNSMPKALQVLFNQMEGIFQRYETLWSKTSAKVIEKNKIIRGLLAQQGHLTNMVEAYAVQVKENGFVLDPRDPKKIAVYLQKVFKVKTGDRGTIFRDDDEIIAQVEFLVSEEGQVYALVKQLQSPTKPVQVFDRILLDLKTPVKGGN